MKAKKYSDCTSEEKAIRDKAIGCSTAGGGNYRSSLSMNRDARLDDTLADLRRITLMKDEDIVKFVQSNYISYAGLRLFYLKKCRLPNPKECQAVTLGLIDLL